MLQGGLSASSHQHPNSGGQPSGHNLSLNSSLNSISGRYGNPYTVSFPASLDGGLTAESSRASFGVSHERLSMFRKNLCMGFEHQAWVQPCHGMHQIIAFLINHLQRMVVQLSGAKNHM